MSKLKLVLGLISLMIIAVVLFAIYGLNNLDILIKRTIEQVGSQTTQTAVTVAEVKLSLQSGRGEIHNLQVANPSEFGSPYAFSITKLALEVDPSSLLQDVAVVKEIKIEGAQFIAEQKGLTELNLYKLLKQIKQSRSAQPAAANEPQPSPSDSKVRLMIEKITFENSQLLLLSEQFGEKTVTLPTFNLSNIGDKQQGLPPQAVGAAILNQLLEQISAAAQTQLRAQFKTLASTEGKDKIKALLEQKLDDKQKKKLNKLKSLLGN